jgi:hypothetical protein
MSPSPKSFKGQLYIITNGGCLSTTGHFVSLVKYHTLALFAGEAPGSHFYCNDLSAQFILPESGIMVNIPQAVFKTKVKGMRRNEIFEMDYPTPLTIHSILDHQDPAMIKIRHLIELSERL